MMFFIGLFIGFCIGAFIGSVATADVANRSMEDMKASPPHGKAGKPC